MNGKDLFVLNIVLLFLAACVPAASQVVPDATVRVIPFSVGGGVSSMIPGRGNGRMLGPTVWSNYRPQFFVRYAGGLSLEAEIRDLAFDRSASQKGLSEATYSGGVNYAWRRFQNFHPYGKVLFGLGTIDFSQNLIVPSNPGTTISTYNHDSRTITTIGGGFDCRIANHVWARVDYEYQIWPGLFSENLHPQGFTLGASYNFRGLRRLHY